MRVTLTAVGFAFLVGGCSAPPQSDSIAQDVKSHRGPDVVVQWNQALSDVLLACGGNPPTSPTPCNPADSARYGAILNTAMFDAVNGIAHRYTQLHETAAAPHGARAEAAAAQAGHDVLVNLANTHALGSVTTYDAILASMVAAIPVDDAEDTDSVNAGLAWGAQVAADTVAWRNVDGRFCNGGLCPVTHAPVFGVNALGAWQPVPPAAPTSSAALPPFVNMVPFVLTSHDQFLSEFQGQVPYDGHQFAVDVNENNAIGNKTSALRTADQTQVAVFYADNSPAHWNRILTAVIATHPRSLVENARAYAALDVAVLDMVITLWNSKYKFNAWRPYTALRWPTSYNAEVTLNSSFVSLVPTPGHQEYGSGHAGVAGVAETVLASLYGDEPGPFTHSTNIAIDGGPAGPGLAALLTSTTRTNTSFSSVAAETNDARVFGGIHLRSTCTESEQIGKDVAHYVLSHALLRLHGEDECEHGHND